MFRVVIAGDGDTRWYDYWIVAVVFAAALVAASLPLE